MKKLILVLLCLSAVAYGVSKLTECRVEIWPRHTHPGTKCRFYDEVLLGFDPWAETVTCGQIRVRCSK